MTPMRLVVLILFLSFCRAFAQINSGYVTRGEMQSELDARELQAWQQAQSDKVALEIRQRQLEESRYDHRSPTPEEVAAMEQKWKDENPLTFSGRMPDFSKQSIRVTKSETVSIESAQLTAKIAELENRMAQMERKRPTLQPTAKRSTVNAKPRPAEQSAAPAPPNPASVIERKLPNGQVMAIIGGKQMQFKNEADAQAYIASLKR